MGESTEEWLAEGRGMVYPASYKILLAAYIATYLTISKVRHLRLIRLLPRYRRI